MPEPVPWAQQSVAVRTLVGQMRSRYPGVAIDVWSPTAEEQAVDGVPATYQEIAIDTPGPERYVIPLHDEDSYELWRVAVTDPPGAGELLGQDGDLTAVVTIGMDAAAAQADPGRVPVSAWEAGWQPLPTVPAEIAGWSPRVNSLASQALHGGLSLNTVVDDPTARRDHDALRAAFQQQAERLDDSRRDDRRPDPPAGRAVLDARASLHRDDLDATLRHLVTANDLRRHDDPARTSAPGPAPAAVMTRTPGQQRDTAVSNAWRSDMTAAAEIETEARSDDTAPLRAEEIAVLERVDPAVAETARTAGSRTAGGRAVSPHRRPERAVERQVPGRDRDRSVDGSD